MFHRSILHYTIDHPLLPLRLENDLQFQGGLHPPLQLMVVITMMTVDRKWGRGVLFSSHFPSWTGL